MKWVRDTAVAGKTIYRDIKLSSGNHKGKRMPKTGITSEMVARNNERLAVRNLTLLINANFGKESSHMTLTYQEEQLPEDAERTLEKFLRRLRYHFKKAGKELKYVVVTEYANNRIHHHMVVNTHDWEKVMEIWKQGWVFHSELRPDGNYGKLAEYLVKETNKTFRTDNGMKRRRYSASRNLFRPVIKREEIERPDLDEDPQPLPGYYIPKDTIRRYEHPVTGQTHMEYYMVAVDEPRRYKKWPRGIAVSSKENFRADVVEVQEQLFDAWDSFDVI